jgi:hypothetical protein
MGTPQGGVITPPTKVQNSVFASTLGKKGEVDSIDDADLSWLKDDAVDEGAKDLSTRGPIGLIQVRAHHFAEAVDTGQGFAQSRLLLSL